MSCRLCFMFSASCKEKRFGKKPCCTRQQLQSTPGHLERLTASQHPVDTERLLSSIVSIVGLVVHNQLVVHKVKAVWAGLVRIFNHQTDCERESSITFKSLPHSAGQHKVRVKRTLPLCWIYQADALPYPTKRSNCSADHTSKALACPFLFFLFTGQVRSKANKGGSSNLTQDYLRNCQSLR